MRDYKGRELLGGDFVLADCAFETAVGIFKDVLLVVQIVVAVVISFDNCASKSSRKQEEWCCEGDEMHRELFLLDLIEQLWIKGGNMNGN